jgi:hypothetical protein
MPTGLLLKRDISCEIAIKGHWGSLLESQISNRWTRPTDSSYNSNLTYSRLTKFCPRYSAHDTCFCLAPSLGCDTIFWWTDLPTFRIIGLSPSSNQRDKGQSDAGIYTFAPKVIREFYVCETKINYPLEQGWPTAGTRPRMQFCAAYGKFLSGCTIGSFSRRAQLREWRFVTNIIINKNWLWWTCFCTWMSTVLSLDRATCKKPGIYNQI